MDKHNLAKHEKSKSNVKDFVNHHYFLLAVIIIAVTVIVGLIIYFDINSSRIYIEKAEISAPIITLSPAISGVLDKVFVKTGDYVSMNMVVAQVNGQPIEAKTSGYVTSVQNTPGQIVGPATPVVQMINPEEFKVVGHIAEDKGLSQIAVGQKAIFTVDTFGSKQYEGVVDSISPSARTSDIVFSISDKREERDFDVYIKFDVSKYPELKNAMSARLWVYV